MDKLDPKEIESIDVRKNLDKNEIRIITKKFEKMGNENAIYINDKKVSQNELNLLDQNTIESMDVNKDEKTIRITTKIDQSKTGYYMSPSDVFKSIFEEQRFDYKQMVIIIDNKLKDYKFLENINPESVEKVNCSPKLFNFSESEKTNMVSKYGEKVLNGIIEIQTKALSK